VIATERATFNRAEALKRMICAGQVVRAVGIPGNPMFRWNIEEDRLQYCQCGVWRPLLRDVFSPAFHTYS
jgi:hypothetical protein